MTPPAGFGMLVYHASSCSRRPVLAKLTSSLRTAPRKTTMQRDRGKYAAPHIDRELTHPSAEQTVDERLAHTPDLYVLDITQFTTSGDMEIVGCLLLRRAHVLTLRSKVVLSLLSSSSSDPPQPSVCPTISDRRR